MRSVPLVRRFCAFLLVPAVLGGAVGCGRSATAGKGSDRPATVSPSADAQTASAVAAWKAAVRQRAAKRRQAVKKWNAAKRARIADRRLFLMSDSVMLGAQYTLPKALPNWKVNLDGKVSRFFQAGLDVLRARRKEIGQVVVIQMGNNYGGDPAVFRSQIDQAMKILAAVRWVVFVTVFEYRSEQAEVNSELRAAAGRYSNVRIADWNAYEHQNPGHTSHDGLHLKPSGAFLMAGFVASVVNALPGA